MFSFKKKKKKTRDTSQDKRHKLKNKRHLYLKKRADTLVKMPRSQGTCTAIFLSKEKVDGLTDTAEDDDWRS